MVIQTRIFLFGFTAALGLYTGLCSVPAHARSNTRWLVRNVDLYVTPKNDCRTLRRLKIVLDVLRSNKAKSSVKRARTVLRKVKRARALLREVLRRPAIPFARGTKVTIAKTRCRKIVKVQVGRHQGFVFVDRGYYKWMPKAKKERYFFLFSPFRVVPPSSSQKGTRVYLRKRNLRFTRFDRYGKGKAGYPMKLKRGQSLQRLGPRRLFSGEYFARTSHGDYVYISVDDFTEIKPYSKQKRRQWNALLKRLWRTGKLIKQPASDRAVKNIKSFKGKLFVSKLSVGYIGSFISSRLLRAPKRYMGFRKNVRSKNGYYAERIPLYEVYRDRVSRRRMKAVYQIQGVVTRGMNLIPAVRAVAVFNGREIWRDWPNRCVKYYLQATRAFRDERKLYWRCVSRAQHAYCDENYLHRRFHRLVRSYFGCVNIYAGQLGYARYLKLGQAVEHAMRVYGRYSNAIQGGKGTDMSLRKARAAEKKAHSLFRKLKPMAKKLKR